jgi:16S rRNA processing protein RimM
VDPEGAALGRVRAVPNYGAGDLLEIAPDQGPSWLVAFTRENVPEVDLGGGRVVVVRPAEAD